MVNTVGTVAREFGLAPRTIIEEWPLAEVLVWAAWSAENNQWVTLERKSPGYIAQEIDKLLNK